MTLIIKTKDQYIPLFEELAKAIGASLEVTVDEQPDNEEAVLDRIERSYKQSKADERGEANLRTLNEFLNSL
ncbi:hypothetical protein [Fibrella arboris]|uniref:hypothetical protein n=1 Tax=Fibrella arboris TaxID=3242486 RepID=UPI003522BBA7